MSTEDIFILSIASWPSTYSWREYRPSSICPSTSIVAMFGEVRFCKANHVSENLVR